MSFNFDIKKMRQVNMQLMKLERASKKYNGILNGAYKDLQTDLSILYGDNRTRLHKPTSWNDAQKINRIINKFNKNYSSTVSGYKAVNHKITNSLKNKLDIDMSDSDFEDYANDVIFGDLSKIIGYRAVLEIIEIEQKNNRDGYKTIRQAEKDGRVRNALLKRLEKYDTERAEDYQRYIDLRNNKK